MSRQSMRHSAKHVSREKYESLKEKAAQWRDECEKLKDKLSVVQDVEADLDRFEDQVSNLRKENEALHHNIKNGTPDTELLDELENENKVFRKEIRSLKRKIKELNEKNRGKLSQMERDILLKDGKIQRLEEARKDLKERYNELKEDFREQQRWNRQKVVGE